MGDVGLITRTTFDRLMNNGFNLIYFDAGPNIINMSLLYKDSDKNDVVSLVLRQEDSKKYYHIINEIQLSESDWQSMTTTDKINEFESKFRSLEYFTNTIRPVVDKLLSEEGFEEYKCQD